MNPFTPGHIVKTDPKIANQRNGGYVKYIACFGATGAGGRTCSRKTCNHPAQDYVWVEWPDGTTSSFHWGELILEGTMAIQQVPIPHQSPKGIGNTSVSSASSGKTNQATPMVPRSGSSPSPGDLAAENAIHDKRVHEEVVREFHSSVKEFVNSAPDKEKFDFDVYNGLKRAGEGNKPNIIRRR